MNMYSSNLGKILSSAGAITGIIVGMKQKSSLGMTALYAGGFAVIGFVLGNQITKFYE